MNITFIVLNPNMSGGIRVCAIYAKKFKELGHQVNIITPRKRFLSIKEQFKRKLKGQLWKTRQGQMQNHFELLGIPVTYSTGYSALRGQDVPDADIVIATWWETAEWVDTFSKAKGEKVYFIQHYEVHAGLPIDRVKRTYQLALHKVTIARWLVSLMQKEYVSAQVFLVPNSVEHNVFYAELREKQDIPCIGFLFSETEFKGVSVALEVIQNLKDKIPQLRVIAFGEKPPESMILPDYVELTINPDQDKIRLLYQQCDLWLCCSLIEGFGLTILEAMACRTPAVATCSGGPEDIISENVNGYLRGVNDVNALTEAAYKILSFSKIEWQEFSDQAYTRAIKYTWDDAANLFAAALQKILSDAGRYFRV